MQWAEQRHRARAGARARVKPDAAASKYTENPRSAGLIFDHSEISARDSEAGFVISGENWV